MKAIYVCVSGIVHAVQKENMSDIYTQGWLWHCDIPLPDCISQSPSLEQVTIKCQWYDGGKTWALNDIIISCLVCFIVSNRMAAKEYRRCHWHVFPTSQLRNSRARNKRSRKFAFSFKSVYWNLIWYLLTKRCSFMPYWKILFFTCPYLQSHKSAEDSLSWKWKLYLSTFFSYLVWTNRDPVKSIQVLLSIHDPKQYKDDTCRLNMLYECSESDVSTFSRDKKLWEKTTT